jgi:hypothetical protein
MTPAQQGFRTDNLVTAQIDYRLVMQQVAAQPPRATRSPSIRRVRNAHDRPGRPAASVTDRTTSRSA